ncbi:hypothetical protein HUU39_11605 [candidate division KSB1 bacterium]|nr:hypothetical protein [bacterium]NUM65903.1 hypothetical protein [candidate division KSB1 bacterium]
MSFPTKKNPGDLVLSADWNDTTNEIVRLGDAKVNKAGDTMSGPLTLQSTLGVAGNVGIGTTTPKNKLDVEGGAVIGATYSGNNTAPENGLLVEGNVGIGTDTPNSKLEVRGALELSEGTADENQIRLTREILAFSLIGTPDSVNNFKLALSKRQLIGEPDPTYEFWIGHPSQYQFGGTTRNTFSTKLSVTSTGDVFVAGDLSANNLTIRSGAKPGYVVDYFLNRTGETLEQGDVVVVRKERISNFWATNNDIPIPEADLTDQAYDSSVCGVVAKVLTEKALPFVEGEWAEQMGLQPEVVDQETGVVKGKTKAEPKSQIPGHPLKKFVAKISAELDQTKVQSKQLGMIVTMGAYAYCKVDADIASIEIGDLLTTSPTKGHAQKVLDKSKAVGAIIGKALGSFKKGKGKIPVLVMLH